MAYVLAETINLKATAGLAWKVGGPVEGVKIFARNERTGQYVRVLESAPTEWVQGEAQAWSQGNFETLAEAQRVASIAYRYINRGNK